jgi:hypothetical protein
VHNTAERGTAEEAAELSSFNEKSSQILKDFPFYGPILESTPSSKLAADVTKFHPTYHYTRLSTN